MRPVTSRAGVERLVVGRSLSGFGHTAPQRRLSVQPSISVISGVNRTSMQTREGYFRKAVWSLSDQDEVRAAGLISLSICAQE